MLEDKKIVTLKPQSQPQQKVVDYTDNPSEVKLPHTDFNPDFRKEPWTRDKEVGPVSVSGPSNIQIETTPDTTVYKELVDKNTGEPWGSQPVSVIDNQELVDKGYVGTPQTDFFPSKVPNHANTDTAPKSIDESNNISFFKLLELYSKGDGSVGPIQGQFDHLATYVELTARTIVDEHVTPVATHFQNVIETYLTTQKFLDELKDVKNITDENKRQVYNTVAQYKDYFTERNTSSGYHQRVATSFAQLPDPKRIDVALSDLEKSKGLVLNGEFYFVPDSYKKALADWQEKQKNTGVAKENTDEAILESVLKAIDNDVDGMATEEEKNTIAFILNADKDVQRKLAMFLMRTAAGSDNLSDNTEDPFSYTIDKNTEGNSKKDKNQQYSKYWEWLSIPISAQKYTKGMLGGKEGFNAAREEAKNTLADIEGATSKIDSLTSAYEQADDKQKVKLQSDIEQLNEYKRKKEEQFKQQSTIVAELENRTLAKLSESFSAQRAEYAKYLSLYKQKKEKIQSILEPYIKDIDNTYGTSYVDVLKTKLTYHSLEEQEENPVYYKNTLDMLLSGWALDNAGDYSIYSSIRSFLRESNVTPQDIKEFERLHKILDQSYQEVLGARDKINETHLVHDQVKSSIDAYKDPSKSTRVLKELGDPTYKDSGIILFLKDAIQNVDNRLNNSVVECENAIKEYDNKILQEDTLLGGSKSRQKLEERLKNVLAEIQQRRKDAGYNQMTTYEKQEFSSRPVMKTLAQVYTETHTQIKRVHKLTGWKQYWEDKLAAVKSLQSMPLEQRINYMDVKQSTYSAEEMDKLDISNVLSALREQNILALKEAQGFLSSAENLRIFLLGRTNNPLFAPGERGKDDSGTSPNTPGSADTLVDTFREVGPYLQSKLDTLYLKAEECMKQDEGTLNNVDASNYDELIGREKGIAVQKEVRSYSSFAKNFYEPVIKELNKGLVPETQITDTFDTILDTFKTVTSMVRNSMKYGEDLAKLLRESNTYVAKLLKKTGLTQKQKDAILAQLPQDKQKMMLDNWKANSQNTAANYGAFSWGDIMRSVLQSINQMRLPLEQGYRGWTPGENKVKVYDSKGKEIVLRDINDNIVTKDGLPVSQSVKVKKDFDGNSVSYNKNPAGKENMLDGMEYLKKQYNSLQPNPKIEQAIKEKVLALLDADTSIPEEAKHSLGHPKVQEYKQQAEKEVSNLYPTEYAQHIETLQKKEELATQLKEIQIALDARDGITPSKLEKTQ